MKVVIVDAAQTNLALMQSLLRQLPDCEPACFTDPVAALDWCLANEPDLLLADYLPPLLDEAGLVAKFHERHPGIPVLLAIEGGAAETRLLASESGVTDFLSRPLDQVEFLIRTKNMLSLRQCRKELAKRTSWLVNEVNTAYQAMERSATQELEALELLDSNLKLEEANRSKNEFLARISHDLRTPLTTILGYSDLLGRDARLAQHSGELSVIRRNAHHLLALIDELLDFARNRIGANQIRPIPLYLHALIDHVMQQAEALAQESGNQAILELRGQLPQVVALDPVVMRRVLFNLLSNAAKFTRKGTLTLRVSAAKNDAGMTQPPGSQTLLFEVIDTGAGIDPAEQERIFEPFYRAASSVHSGIPGSGLGLAICRQWAQAMGGDITLQSVVGEGSCFTFRLPCPSANEADIDIVDTAQPSAVDGAGHRILLVEDVADLRRYLADLLSGAGFTVTAAANGREALLLAGQSETPPSTVITDQTMPEMDGWELLRALRLQYDPALPVILLSATPAHPPAGWAAHMQFDASLSKPVDSNRLLATLARLLNLAAPQPDAASARPRQNVAAFSGLAVPDEILPPNAARLRKFQAWAEQGALSFLENQAHELVDEHPEYEAFARFILERTAALDLEGIAAYCANTLELQKANPS